MFDERDIERWRQNNNLYGEAEFKELRQELKEARTRIAKLEGGNQQLKKRNEELQKLVASMEKELSAAKVRIAELESEIKNLRKYREVLRKVLMESGGQMCIAEYQRRIDLMDDAERLKRGG